MLELLLDVAGLEFIDGENLPCPGGAGRYMGVYLIGKRLHLADPDGLGASVFQTEGGLKGTFF